MITILFHPRVLIVVLACFGIALATRMWRNRQRAIITATPVHPRLPPELRQGREIWVLFTTPWCAMCGVVEELLAEWQPDQPVVHIDASSRPELAAMFSISTSPTVLAADADGVIIDRMVGAEAVRQRMGSAA